MSLALSNANYQSAVLGFHATASLNSCGFRPYLSPYLSSKIDFDRLILVRNNTVCVAIGILKDLMWIRFPNVRRGQLKWVVFDLTIAAIATTQCNELLDRIAYRGKDLPSVTDVRRRLHWILCITGVVALLGLLALAMQGQSTILLSFFIAAAAKELSSRLLTVQSHEKCMKVFWWTPLALSLATLSKHRIQGALILQLLPIFQEYLQRVLEEFKEEGEDNRQENTQQFIEQRKVQPAPLQQLKEGTQQSLRERTKQKIDALLEEVLQLEIGCTKFPIPIKQIISLLRQELESVERMFFKVPDAELPSLNKKLKDVQCGLNEFKEEGEDNRQENAQQFIEQHEGQPAPLQQRKEGAQHSPRERTKQKIDALREEVLQLELGCKKLSTTTKQIVSGLREDLEGVESVFSKGSDAELPSLNKKLKAVQWSTQTLLENMQRRSQSRIQAAQKEMPGTHKQIKASPISLQQRKEKVRQMDYEKMYLDKCCALTTALEERRTLWYRNFMASFADSSAEPYNSTALNEVWSPQICDNESIKSVGNRENWLRAMTGDNFPRDRAAQQLRK